MTDRPQTGPVEARTAPSRARAGGGVKPRSTAVQSWAFIGIAYSYLLIMAGTTIPTPMYPLYQNELHFSVFVITVVFATYVVGVLVALFVFGRWSDIFGRRPLMLAALASALISTGLFLVTDSLAVLLLARLFSGLAAGIFVGTATVAMVELAPAKWAKKASFVATAVNVGGLGVGPLFAGLVIEYIDYEPLRTTFWILLGLLLISVVIVFVIPEPVARTKNGAIPAVEKMSVPPQVRGAFQRAVWPGVTGFAVLGLFGAVSPTLLRGQMHVENVAVQGVAVFVVFLASAITQLSITNAAPAAAVRAGCVAIIIGALGVGLGVFLESPILFIVSGMLCGAGQGATLSKGVAQVAAVLPEDRKAAVTSTLFFCFYIGLAVPAVAIGAASLVWGIVDTTIVFAGICAAVAVAALVIHSKSATKPGLLADSGRTSANAPRQPET